MKTISTFFACVAISVSISHAQTPESTINLKPAPSAITIDGDLQEWGDTLRYLYPQEKIHYTLANDKENLYLVIKTKDPVQQGNILGAGVTLSIDTKGKNRPTYAVTFPAAGRNDNAASFIKMDPAEAKLKAQITRFRRIQVDGFKDIEDGEITTRNTNGILVSIAYDANDNLIYEEAIPLSLFHADASDNEWAYNIKFNALEHTASLSDAPAESSSGGGKKSKGGGSKSKDSSASNGATILSPAIGFWGKFMLAKM